MLSRSISQLIGGNQDRGDKDANVDANNSEEDFRGFSPVPEKPEKNSKAKSRRGRKRKSKELNTPSDKSPDPSTSNNTAPCVNVAPETSATALCIDPKNDTAPCSDTESSTSSEMSSGDSSILSHLLFDGKDYFIWKRRIRNHLSAKELEKTIQEDSNSSAKDKAKAFNEIARHVSNSVFRLIKEEQDPYKLLPELDQRYGKTDEAMVVECRTKLATIDIDKFKCPKDYCNEVTKLVNDIESAKVVASKSEEFAFLKAGLRNKSKWLVVIKAAEAILQVTAPDPKILHDLLTNGEEINSEGTSTQNKETVSFPKASALVTSNNERRSSHGEN